MDGRVFAVSEASDKSSSPHLIKSPCLGLGPACKLPYVFAEALVRGADWLVLFQPDVYLIPAQFERRLSRLPLSHMLVVNAHGVPGCGEKATIDVPNFVCRHKSVEFLMNRFAGTVATAINMAALKTLLQDGKDELAGKLSGYNHGIEDTAMSCAL